MPRGSVSKVLITADAVGGVWTYAVDLARALVERRISVDLAVLGPAPGEVQRRAAAEAGVTLHEGPYRLEWMDDPWSDVDAAGEWLLDLERTLAPDVVHLNGYAQAALHWRAPAILVAHSCVCSWWRAVRGDEVPARLAEYRRRVRAGLASARAIVAPSYAMLQALEDEYGVVPSGCVIPNGRRFEPVAGVAREPIVFSAGRLWDEAKNIQALCAAAPSIQWPVFVAGDTRDPLGRGRALDGVRALGSLTSGDIALCYARASIYALPARYEPFGLSVLEAARSGCALVLGDIPSLRENWDGAAVFVPSDSRRALVAALRGLIEHEPRRRQLAAQATARAAQFSVSRMADAYVRVYSEVAAPVAAGMR